MLITVKKFQILNAWRIYILEEQSENIQKILYFFWISANDAAQSV